MLGCLHLVVSVVVFFQGIMRVSIDLDAGKRSLRGSVAGEADQSRN
jgi:hypothetical protein